MGAGRANQHQRGRAPGRHPAQAADGQERLAGRLVPAGDHLHGPDDPSGRRHPGPRAPALRQGAPAGPPGHPGSARRRAPGHPRRLGLLPGRLEPAPPAHRRDPRVGRRGRRRDRHRDQPRARADRRLAGALRRGPRLPRGLRAGAPQSDPRHRRARHPAQRGAGEPGRDDGRRGLHQDLDRQGEGERHAAGLARHGARHPRLPRAHRLPDRLQAGGRDLDREGRGRLAGADERGAGGRLDEARSVPDRCVEPAGRHRAPARAPRHGPLLGLLPPPPRLRRLKMSVAEIFETMEYGPAPESADPAQAWLEARDREILPFIDGAFRRPATDEFFDTLNPGNGKTLARVAQGGAAEVDAAVAAARAAQPLWWELGGHGRARHLYALARHIQKNARLLAVLETMDNGKPIRETRDLDVPLVARHFYHHAGWAQLMERELPGYVPVGVAGQIIPWNFPLLMLAWKIAPALAMGNTVVLKPAEFTPLTATAFAEICRDAGLPPGVVNIVHGDGRTGELMVRHPGIDKIAFTGSTDVGRLIREATAGTGKRLSLELGGKSPFVVFDDADLDGTVEGVVDAIWFNQGQVCCAGSRLIVQEGVAETLYTRLRARMETLRVGDPRDKAIDIGAIIAPVQLERIERLVRQGVEEGAKVWQPSWSCPQEGWFYPPTLFTGVAPSATIAQVEIFGPVLVAMTFRTPEEAIELANNTRFGLAASVWTENINLALEIAVKIKAGTVWINSTNLFDAAAGFGGYRESGFGREGGKEGLWEYVRPGREAGPAGRRALAEDCLSRGPAGRRGGRGEPQGHSQCCRGRPQGRSRLGEGHGA